MHQIELPFMCMARKNIKSNQKWSTIKIGVLHNQIGWQRVFIVVFSVFFSFHCNGMHCSIAVCHCHQAMDGIQIEQDEWQRKRISSKITYRFVLFTAHHIWHTSKFKIS